MKVVLNNKANLPNKHIRYTVWKLYCLKEKFEDLLFADIYFKTIGQLDNTVMLTINIRVAGERITVQKKGANIMTVINQVYKKAHRLLNRHK